MVSCARATRGLEGPRWTRAVGDHLVRPQGRILGRVHLRIDQATLEKEVGDWENACSEGRFACSLRRR